LGLLLLLGCSSTRAKAEGRRVLVEVGMTGREVVDRIGRPSKVFPVARTPEVSDQTIEVWEYTLKTPPDLGDAAEFAVAAGALVVFAVATKGNDTHGIGGLGLKSKGRCTFWVGYGSDGRVRGVTDVGLIR